jgi:hypothetical protein
MKRLAMILAVVVGIIPGITSQVAYSDSSIDFIQTPIISETSNKQNVLDVEDLRKRNIAEINFTVRMYLWALAQRHPKILAKVTAPALRARFPDVRSMLVSMSLAHGPVMGTKNVFLHTPAFMNRQTVQTVYFIGRHGNHWMGQYKLNRDENGEYGIANYMIKKLAGEFS